MKIYLYNTETGLYEGEDFVERNSVNEQSGVTAIAPPEGKKGNVPVFDGNSGEWRLVPLQQAGDDHGK